MKTKLNSGMKIAQLTLLSSYPIHRWGRPIRMWKCICSCGRETIVQSEKLLSGNTKSCGCLRFRKRTSEEKKQQAKHGACSGGKGSPEYMTWIRMRRRCENPEAQDYPRYGGRGIQVCSRWDSFECFIQDMGKRPGRGYSIGRIDNEGDYCPENCRWETIYQQNGNKGDTRFLIIDGVKRNVVAWSKESGVHPETIRGRLRRGWSAKEAVFGEIRQVMLRTGKRWSKRN